MFCCRSTTSSAHQSEKAPEKICHDIMVALLPLSDSIRSFTKIDITELPKNQTTLRTIVLKIHELAQQNSGLWREEQFSREEILNICASPSKLEALLSLCCISNMV